MAFGQNSGQQGMAFLQQVQKMQQGQGGTPPGGAPGTPPNPITGGLIAKLMSDNPGGLLGAIRGQMNQPDPNAPLPPGWQGPLPPGAAPAAGGPPKVGMLASLFPQYAGAAGGGAQPQQLPAPPPLDPGVPNVNSGW